jgi:hypothetical protein
MLARCGSASAQQLPDTAVLQVLLQKQRLPAPPIVTRLLQLLTICSMAPHLPAAALRCSVGPVVLAVVQSSELLAPPASFSTGASSSFSSPISSALRDAMRLHTMASLTAVLRAEPSALSAHVLSLVPSLLALGCSGCLCSSSVKPAARAAALDALRSLASSTPYHLLHPVRQLVIRSLEAALDDPKRSVRRRAGACRNDYALLTGKASVK